MPLVSSATAHSIFAFWALFFFVTPVHGVRSIVFPSEAALSHRKPVSAGTSRVSYCAEGHDKRGKGKVHIDSKLHNYLKITGILNNVFRPQKKLLRKQE